MAACDVACQKNKQLKTLLTSLQSATVNKGTDPEAYELARVNYYTVKEGQGWLQTEKERIAKLTLQPIMDKYKKQYAATQPSAPTQSDEVGDEDETRFIHNQIEKERDRAGVHQRLMELTVDGGPTVQWLPYVLDIVIAGLALTVVYMLFTKFYIIKNYLFPSTTISTL